MDLAFEGDGDELRVNTHENDSDDSSLQILAKGLKSGAPSPKTNTTQIVSQNYT